MGWEEIIRKLERFNRKFETICPLCGNKSFTCRGVIWNNNPNNDVTLFIGCDNCKKKIARTVLPIDSSERTIRKVQDKDLKYLIDYLKK